MSSLNSRFLKVALCLAGGILAYGCSNSEEGDSPAGMQVGETVPDYSRLPVAFEKRLLKERAALELSPDDPVLLFNLARLYHANRFYSRAKSIYIQLLDTDESILAAKAHHYLADISRYSGNIEDAIFHLKEVVFLQPEYSPAYLSLGDNLYKQGETEMAIEAYKTVHTLDSNNPFASIALARDQLDRGHPAAAIQLLENAVSSNPYFSEGLVLLAKLLDESGDFERASRMRRQNENGWDLPPKDPWLEELIFFNYDVQSLGFQFEDYKRVGEIERGLTFLQRMEEINPEDPTPHLLRGNMFYDYERREEAEQELLQAIKKGAPPEHAYPVLVKTQIELGKLDQAEISAKEGLSRDPHIPLLLVSLGGIEIQRRDFKKAEDYLQQALLQDPADTFVNRVLADLFLEQDNLLKAVEHLERLAQLLPDDLESRMEIARINLRLELPEKAISRLSEAMNLAPDNADVKSLLSEVYVSAGNNSLKHSDYPVAIIYFSKAIELNSRLLDAYRGKVQAHIRANELSKAESTLLQVISLYPKVAQFYSTLGDIQHAAGKPEKARQSWQTAKNLLTNKDSLSLRQKLDSQLSK